MGLAFHYRRVNRDSEQWFGLDPREMKGRHIRDVLGEAAWQLARARSNLELLRTDLKGMKKIKTPF